MGAVESDCSFRLVIVSLFRGSSRFESFASHHSRFTCECNKEDTTEDRCLLQAFLSLSLSLSLPLSLSLSLYVSLPLSLSREAGSGKRAAVREAGDAGAP